MSSTQGLVNSLQRLSLFGVMILLGAAVGCGPGGADGGVPLATTVHREELFRQFLPLPPSLDLVATVDAEGLTQERTYEIRYFVISGGTAAEGVDGAVAVLKDHLESRQLTVRSIRSSTDWPVFQTTGAQGSGLGFISMGRLDRLLSHGEAAIHAVDDDLRAAVDDVSCCAVLAAETN